MSLGEGGMALMTLGIGAAAAPAVGVGLAVFTFATGATMLGGALWGRYGGGGGGRLRIFAFQR